MFCCCCTVDIGRLCGCLCFPAFDRVERRRVSGSLLVVCFTWGCGMVTVKTSSSELEESSPSDSGSVCISVSCMYSNKSRRLIVRTLWLHTF